MSAAVQYVTDDKGNKVAVILPITEYQHLKEDLHDRAPKPPFFSFPASRSPWE